MRIVMRVLCIILTVVLAILSVALICGLNPLIETLKSPELRWKPGISCLSNVLSEWKLVIYILLGYLGFMLTLAIPVGVWPKIDAKYCTGIRHQLDSECRCAVCGSACHRFRKDLNFASNNHESGTYLGSCIRCHAVAIEVHRVMTCPRCNGEGGSYRWDDDGTCDHCGGSGTIGETERIIRKPK